MRKFLLKSAIAMALGLVIAPTDVLAQRGGGGPGGGGSFSPEQVWQMYGGGTNSVIDLNKNPQAKSMMQSRGYTIPSDGILRKDSFLREVESRNQSKSGGGRPGGGGPPSMGGPSAAPTTSSPGVIVIGGSTPTPAPDDRGGKDRGGRGGPGGGGDFGGGGFGGFGRGGGGSGESTTRKEDIEDERPNVLRYGKMPTKDLPSWFIELDTDKDGQVGLYEWRAAKKDMDEFAKYDLNGDGFITAEELLRGRGVDTVAGSGGSSKSSGGNPFMKNNGGGNGAGMSDRDTGGGGGKKGDKRRDETKKEEKPTSGGEKKNPFTNK